MPNADHDRRCPVETEYSKLARIYDERWSHYIEASLRETLKRMDLYSCRNLLDVGCGTGVLLEKLKNRHPGIHLTGIDSTQEMLDIAAKRLPEDIHIERSLAESLPFEDSSFDIVVSCNMFHYIRKPVAALKEAKRVLKETGTIVITDWCDDYIPCRICNLFLRYFNAAHYKIYGKEALHALLSSSGFSNIKIDKYKMNWFWGMMTATASKKAL